MTAWHSVETKNTLHYPMFIVVYLRILKGNHSNLVYISPVSLIGVQWRSYILACCIGIFWVIPENLGWLKVLSAFLNAWPLCHSVFQQQWSIQGAIKAASPSSFTNTPVWDVFVFMYTPSSYYTLLSEKHPVLFLFCISFDCAVTEYWLLQKGLRHS